jgi:hypothetical protein
MPEVLVSSPVETAPVQDAANRVHARSWIRRRAGAFLLAAIVVVYVLATVLAMRQTSATFDEILLPAGGARGYVTGNFDLVELYHPRLMQYVYGLPVVFSRPAFPEEAGQWTNRAGFRYAQELYFGRGNDAEMLVFRARLIAMAVGAALVLLVFAFVRRHYGEAAAVIAAAMTAFLPDLLAHGGISYNDVPIALAYFGAVWGLDRAVRTPAVKTVLVAAVLVAIALSVKYSAVALAPIAAVLIAIEALARRHEWKAYVRRVAWLLPLAVLGAYLSLVTLYLGDVTLSSFRAGLDFNVLHAAHGHAGVPAWLLGRSSQEGFWYFFPLAFLIKTPAALHILLALAVLGALSARGDARDLLRSPLRGPVVAALVFSFFLMRANLNIGFRHAMPVLPFVVAIAAAGLWRLWRTRGVRMRAAIAGLVTIQAVSVLSWYPHFIPYTSEYFPERDLGFMRLTDSNHDWGQGLPLLRDFMREEGVQTVYLSYFGSARPEAYGVSYTPLRSFFLLAPPSDADSTPRFAAISATNLVGGYVGDAFAGFRTVEPYRVLGHSIFVYRIDE